MTDCNICTCEFDLEEEGGIIGELGILPVAFCPNCLNGILDLADQLRIKDDEDVLREQLEATETELAELKHRLENPNEKRNYDFNPEDM